MKSKSEIRALLGITQQQFAMILGISRSHLAMCETGKREWPANTMTKFAILLKQVQAPQTIDKRAARIQSDTRREAIMKWHKETEYQLETVKRKMSAAVKKQEAGVRIRQLNQSFEGRQTKEIRERSAMHLISEKASRSLKKDEETELLKLEIRLEVLAFEKTLLESKLKKLS